MISQKIIVNIESGLHARPATLLVKEANRFESEISIIKEETEGNLKSILNIMAMAIKKGDEITIKAEGIDENEAVLAVINLFQSGFGE